MPPIRQVVCPTGSTERVRKREEGRRRGAGGVFFLLWWAWCLFAPARFDPPCCPPSLLSPPPPRPSSVRADDLLVPRKLNDTHSAQSTDPTPLFGSAPPPPSPPQHRPCVNRLSPRARKPRVGGAVASKPRRGEGVTAPRRARKQCFPRWAGGNRASPGWRHRRCFRHRRAAWWLTRCQQPAVGTRLAPPVRSQAGSPPPRAPGPQRGSGGPTRTATA